MAASFSEWVEETNIVLSEFVSSPDGDRLHSSISVASKVLELLVSEAIPGPTEVVDERVLKLPNSERQDSWFRDHPWMGSTKSAFELIDSANTPLQAKFYWLQRRSNANLVGAVHFTPNWEDHDYTRNDQYKIGIDFFLNSDSDGTIIALSKRGKVRVMELGAKLSNTQVEVFQNWWSLDEFSDTETLHATIWESFRLQQVNAKFYLGVANAFSELEGVLVGQGRPAEESKMFSSRLLGRLIFVWFLRKMGLINTVEDYFSPNEDDATYYRTKLERLFFRTLNLPVQEREPEQGSLDLITPYLNGGLFAPREDDWVDDLSLQFPSRYFSRLFEHFNNFNFTTDESTPEYEQVAIDPEMLGRVFESLLASQIEETGEQARKAKGAFYTPREIVSFMCREAVRAYLIAELEDVAGGPAAITKILDTADHVWALNGSNSIRDIPKELRTRISEALRRIKSIDPACGSGAFPLGLLQLLCKLHLRLDTRLDTYKLKLAILQENIFGVDIEPMAVEISRLRSWLSLIIEERELAHVKPLPNLEFNFVCANSLVRLMDEDLFTNKTLQDNLALLREQYFTATSPQSKLEIQRKYFDLIAPDLFDDALDERAGQLKSYNPFDAETVSKFFDADYMFGVEQGFDVIIGNPPYVDSENMTRNAKGLRDYLRANYRTTRGNWDLFVPFIELALENTSVKGVVAFIVKNSLLGAPYAATIRSELAQKGVQKVWDFGGVEIFESAAVDTCVFIVSKSQSDPDVEFVSMKSVDQPRYQHEYQRDELLSASSWVPFVVSPTIKEVIDRLRKYTNLANSGFVASAAATVGEAYQIAEVVHEYEPSDNVEFKLINTGSIDPFVNSWGVRPIRYLGHDYSKPVVSEAALSQISVRRLEQAKRPKIVVIGMGNVEAFLDKNGSYLAAKTTSILWNSNDDKLHETLVVLGILNSKIARFWFKYMYLNAGFAGVRPQDLLSLPIPSLTNIEADKMVNLVEACIETGAPENLEALEAFVYELFDIKPEEVEPFV